MHLYKNFAVALILCACGASAPPPAASPKVAAPATAVRQAAPREGLRIELATVYVDDLDKALRFYTEVLGFAKEDDVRKGPYRWLTVASPADPDGAELHLAPDDNPAAKAFQEAMFAQGEPAVMFYTDDVKRDYERMKARGAEFTTPPTEVMPGVIIAIVNDTCGNLVQISQVASE